MRGCLWLGVALLVLACGPRAAPATDGASPAAAPGAGSASPAAALPPAPVAMRFGLNTTGPQAAPAWIAKDEGFFAKYGIDPELIGMQSSAQLAPALIAGELPIALSAAAGIVNSALAGSDLVLLGGYSNHLVFWFYSRPEFTSVQELRGKRIAVTRRGSATDLATDLVLARNGLDPERDVIRLQLGGSPEKLAALFSGAIDATLLATDRFIADEQGMRMLVDVGDYNYPLVLQGIAASRGWIASNEDLTRRTLQALAEGVAFAHQQKERTKAIIAKYTATEDPRMLEQMYTLIVPRWERTLHVPPDALRNELAALADDVPAARDARPEQFLDTRFVDELDRAGFFQQLYQ